MDGRQYCGQLGKQDNCQVAVSLPLTNGFASLPVAYRLYLPQDWADDAVRRAKAGVPDDVAFKTKPQLALEQITWACATGLPRGVVLMDAGYGVDARLRLGLTALGLIDVAEVLPNTLASMPGADVMPPQGAPMKGRRDNDNIVSLKEIALAISAAEWRTVSWREGTCDVLTSRFARVCLRVAHRHAGNHAEEWLLVEWPESEPEPTKYWLSTLPADIAFERLVETAKLRWRIERDYHDLKQVVGLGHYEGRACEAWLRHDAGVASIITNALHRGLRLPHLRAGDHSPLKTTQPTDHAATCRFRKLSTPRRRRCGLNGTCRTQSRLCTAV